jgi:hypothetical protein
LEKSIKLGHNRISEVDGQHVVSGIFEAENEIMKQILEAYRATVPAAEEACKQVLPGLPTLFSWDEFSNVVKRRRDELRNLDRTEVMQALIEIGAVGKFVGQTDKYNVATFEYMVPHRLVASLQDKFCIHPVFTETFGADSKFLGAKPVYTYWSETIPPDLI